MVRLSLEVFFLFFATSGILMSGFIGRLPFVNNLRRFSNKKDQSVIQNRNVFLYAQNAIDPIEQIDFSNSTMLFSSNNLTSTDIVGYSTSGSGSFSENGSGDFSGSGSGDGEFASYQPLTCSAPNGVKSEAITRKFRHLMQNIYKARFNIRKIS